MIRCLRGLAAGLAAAGLLTGCGIEPTGVFDSGQAPTGVAPGVTVYLVDSTGTLRPSFYKTGRLGDIPRALDLLLRGYQTPGDVLHTEIDPVGTLGPVVTTSDAVISVMLPLARYELGARGIDQLVCTVLGVHRQAGGSRVTKVVLTFTIGNATEPRSCPILG
ncbi:MAG: hypothetical protein QOG19_2365 [Mycobacterium sp.]|nr:hypothetical protein [Mycobacterium sp.]